LIRIGAALILTGYALIFWYQGFWVLSDQLSPLNVIGWAVNVATLAPGLGLIWLGNWLKARHDIQCPNV
jgi:hypothetical protein